MRICKSCLEEKPKSEYHYRANNKEGLCRLCKVCENKRIRAWADKNRDRIRENNRWSRIFTDYNLTKEQYESMVSSQNGVCAICEEPEKTRRGLAIDHDHKCCSGPRSCGECIRGLLCIKCNSLLGMCDDSIMVLNRALTYLEGMK